MLANQGAMAYTQVNRISGVEGANPHQLVDMLMEGALDKISVAKGLMTRNEIAAKGLAISKAIAILDGLRGSLDEAGGEITTNLNDLYDYMQRRLMDANQQNDTQPLDEVTKLLSDLRVAWNSIPEDLHMGSK
ncbi:MAG TPA: flagellar export chaperone FliS [Chromatiales bacterium]|nr:flagellar export chaperone FliS [Thiotrichales bacterium]HIP69406.1 flagellar export chaperone FliS [Chromatiales bacterium]